MSDAADTPQGDGSQSTDRSSFTGLVEGRREGLRTDKSLKKACWCKQGSVAEAFTGVSSCAMIAVRQVRKELAEMLTLCESEHISPSGENLRRQQQR